MFISATARTPCVCMYENVSVCMWHVCVLRVCVLMSCNERTVIRMCILSYSAEQTAQKAQEEEGEHRGFGLRDKNLERRRKKR